jgi:hypothetical protein
MALVPEHNLPALVHAHHMAPREAPGHSIDSSTEEKEGQVLGQGGGSVGGRGQREWVCSLALPLTIGPGKPEVPF